MLIFKQKSFQFYIPCLKTRQPVLPTWSLTKKLYSFPFHGFRFGLANLAFLFTFCLSLDAIISSAWRIAFPSHLFLFAFWSWPYIRTCSGTKIAQIIWYKNGYSPFSCKFQTLVEFWPVAYAWGTSKLVNG